MKTYLWIRRITKFCLWVGGLGFLSMLGLSTSGSTMPLLSAADLDRYRLIFAEIEEGRWENVSVLLRRVSDPLPGKVIHWLDLQRQESGLSFGHLTRFIDQNRRWPHLRTLLRRTEEWLSIDDNAQELTPQAIVTWLRRYSPRTLEGWLILLDALTTLGETNTLRTLVPRVWISNRFDDDSGREFRRRYGAYIRPEHDLTRLDRLLWQTRATEVRSLFEFISPAYQRLAQARLHLVQRHPASLSALQMVPQWLQRDPGLVYQQVKHFRSIMDNDAAVDLLEDPPTRLVHPDRWWLERHILIRRYLAAQEYQMAYDLAHHHRQHRGLSYAQAEFLAGWIALRFLDRPDIGFSHFHNLYRSVVTPVSRARGAYWLGRAAERLGAYQEAQNWYEAALRFTTTYYGQLAAIALGRNIGTLLTSEYSLPVEQTDSFNQRELVRVVHTLSEIFSHQPHHTIAPFLERLLSHAKTSAALTLIAQLALQTGHPHFAVQASKRARLRSVYSLIDLGYPTLELPGTITTEPALVLSLIRQESLFNPRAVSPKNAHGLMQLLPRTAQQIATQHSISDHNTPRLIEDPAYNITLGEMYLAEQLTRFSNSYVLAIAAYNAGPNQVEEWRLQNGDPRGKSVYDVIDWIELIPYYQTRNYVHRILETLAIYRYNLDHNTTITLDHDLIRGEITTP